MPDRNYSITASAENPESFNKIKQAVDGLPEEVLRQVSTAWRSSPGSYTTNVRLVLAYGDPRTLYIPKEVLSIERDEEGHYSISTKNFEFKVEAGVSTPIIIKFV